MFIYPNTPEEEIKKTTLLLKRYIYFIFRDKENAIFDSE